MSGQEDVMIKDEIEDYKDETDESEEEEEDEDELDDAMPEKEPADVSHYSLEEKIVAAVWVHERVRNNMTWDAMMRNFRARFKNKPPSKQTLLCWERKLFTTGNAHDKVRTGRPIARLMHVPYVKQSIEESPNLSIRERAKELGLPYATLLKILKEDLKMAYVLDSEAPKRKSTVASPNTGGKWKFVDNGPAKKPKTSSESNGGSAGKVKTEALNAALHAPSNDSTTSSTVTAPPTSFNNIPDNQASAAYTYGLAPNQIQPGSSMVSSVTMYQNYANF